MLLPHEASHELCVLHSAETLRLASSQTFSRFENAGLKKAFLYNKEKKNPSILRMLVWNIFVPFTWFHF